MKLVAAALAVLALSGCAAFVPWVHAHAQGLAAIGLVAGTLTTVEQAVVNADEVEVRARRHVQEESEK